MKYPIVEYAHKIGKNTAEFTTKDLAGFMKWWLKQKPREDLLRMTPEQKKKYDEDMEAMKQWRGVGRMEPQEERVKGNFAADSVVEGEEVVCSMELTRADIDALLFSINRTFADYEMEEGNPYTVSLTSLKEGLEGV